MTVQIEEVVVHAGSPMRLELLQVNNPTPCLILDHIPHNPTSQPGGNCKVKEYPVGACTGSSYYLTVNIPDVDCDKCQLRLSYINVDSLTGSNSSCTTSNCITYYSCADIKIRGEKTLDEACRPSASSWPYRPRFSFTADMKPENEVPPVNTSNAAGSATLTLRDNTLEYIISYQGLGQFAAAHIHGPASPTENAGVQYIISEFTKLGGSDEAQGKWTNLTETQIDDMKDGLYYINIHSNDFPDGEIRGQILLTKSEFLPGSYVSEDGDYNSDGWLSGQDFVGAAATASRFVVGFGQCSVNTKCFGTVVKSPETSNVIGTAAIQMTSNRAWFGLDVGNRPGDIQAVRIEQNEVYDSEAIDLTEFRKTPGHVMGVLELNSQQSNALERGGFKLTVTFTNSPITLTGKFEQGMIAMLNNEFEVPKSPKSPQGVGTAFIRFRRDTSINVDITVSGLSTDLTKAHIHGPGRQGQTGPLRFDLSTDINNLSSSDAHVQSTVSDLLADHVRYMWENRLYINMHTVLAPTGELRNQICAPGSWQCTVNDINLCFATNLTVEQAVPPVKLPTSTVYRPKPAGLAGAKFDRLGNLHYSIALHNVQKADITGANIHGPAAAGEIAPSIVVINHTLFTPKAGQRDRVLEISGWTTLTDEQKRYASEGRLYFNIRTSDYTNGLLRGQLPPIQRSRCASSPQDISLQSPDGDERFDPGHPYEDLYVQSGDRITIQYPGNNRVYLLDNQNSYDQCAVLDSQIIGDSIGDANTVNVTFIFTQPGTYYFAGNEADCKKTPAMKFRAIAVAGVDPDDVLPVETCQSTSFAAVVVAKEDGGSQGSAVVAAAFVGLAVGAVILVLIFVMNYRRARSGAFDVKE
ncbi:uncharacterized protein LOC134176139 isoform X2 [Corticium candelabrum]|nr:uncharacterized protein LOC134176139 isoform X2 [Corticium candelabrum]